MRSLTQDQQSEPVGSTAPPVAARLVHTAIALLGKYQAESLPVPELLEQANASYADIHTEFGGMDGLIDAAYLSQVSSRSREGIELAAAALEASRSYEEVLQHLARLTAFVRDPSFKNNRVMRAVVIGSTLHRPELADALAQAQNTLTNRLADVIAHGEQRGLYHCVTSPRSIAAFIQAFTAGQILDEIDYVQTPIDEWVQMVGRAVRSLLIPTREESEQP
jgi:AcrR family transcriptional regulator